MPALSPKENWRQPDAEWVDVLFKLDGAGDKEYA